MGASLSGLLVPLDEEGKKSSVYTIKETGHQLLMQISGLALFLNPDKTFREQKELWEARIKIQEAIELVVKGVSEK